MDLIYLLKLLGKIFGQKTGNAGAMLVSAALDVEDDPYSKSITSAIAAIDAVHSDGQLPHLPIKRLALAKGMHGRFRHRNGGAAIEIAIHYATSHAELTTMHEIGHFLDYAGFEPANEFASVSGDLLNSWRLAIKNSDAVQRLAYLWRFPSNKIQETRFDGNVVEYNIEKSYIEYLLQNEELWARSYAQFIAVKSGNPELLAQLNHLRDRPARSLYYWEQWDDDDFLTIAVEIEALFRQIGWMS